MLYLSIFVYRLLAYLTDNLFFGALIYLEIPQKIIDELSWEDGTVVEWERNYDGKIILRNIEGLDIN